MHAKRLSAPLHLWLARRRLDAFHSRPRSLEEVVDAAMDLGTHGLVKVKAKQIRFEILALARAVEDLRPRTILEIGTARSGTLLLWAQLARDQVITCDLVQPECRRRLYPFFAPPGSTCRVTALRGNSHDAALQRQVEQALAGRPVDFLFIDGDHTLAGVQADYEDYRPLVRPGGCIALHDIVPRQPVATTRIHEFWRALRSRETVEELVEDWDQVGYGIGLVRV